MKGWKLLLQTFWSYKYQTDFFNLFPFLFNFLLFSFCSSVSCFLSLEFLVSYQLGTLSHVFSFPLLFSFISSAWAFLLYLFNGIPRFSLLVVPEFAFSSLLHCHSVPLLPFSFRFFTAILCFFCFSFYLFCLGS